MRLETPAECRREATRLIVDSWFAERIRTLVEEHLLPGNAVSVRAKPDNEVRDH